MTMNVTHNYSQFYKGSEPLKSYGSGGEGLMVPKDTLVKYEFNTTDEHGNKIMAPLSREEALRVMKEVSGQETGCRLWPGICKTRSRRVIGN